MSRVPAAAAAAPRPFSYRSSRQIPVVAIWRILRQRQALCPCKRSRTSPLRIRLHNCHTPSIPPMRTRRLPPTMPRVGLYLSPSSPYREAVRRLALSVFTRTGCSRFLHGSRRRRRRQVLSLWRDKTVSERAASVTSRQLRLSRGLCSPLPSLSASNQYTGRGRLSCIMLRDLFSLFLLFVRSLFRHSSRSSILSHFVFPNLLCLPHHRVSRIYIMPVCRS